MQTSILRYSAPLFLVALCVLGCKHQYSNYCPGALNDNCLNVDAPVAQCTTDQECAPQVCDLTGSKTCVQCTSANPSACTGVSPVCGSEDTCRACTSHTECSSNACLPDGSCGTDANVAYVDPAGTDNGICTKAMPCTKVAKALATSRPYVKFHGTTDEAVTVNGGRTLSFLADPGAKLTRSTGNGAILTIQDDNTTLSVYDLSLSNAPNTPSGIGCVIPAASGAPALSLTRATVMNNPGGGIVVSGGMLALSQSTISNNTGGGININNAHYDIVNSFIVGNGSNTTGLGGLKIDGITTAGTHHFAFNTVAANLGPATINTGILCGTVLVPVLISDSVVFANLVSGGGVQIGGSANCTAVYSDVGPDPIAGTGNINQDPKFVSPATGDYHLHAGSPAENMADPAATVSVDFDGDARPHGGRSDMGADEVEQ